MTIVTLVASVGLIGMAGIARAVPVSSPDGKVVCEFETVGGVPTVSVRYAGVAAGRLAVAVREGPFALSSKNVPIGMQVIGNTYDDLAAMRVSAALSKVVPQNFRDGRFPDFRNQK